MSRVYITEEDETLVRQILRKGLRAPEREPKWKVLRIALAFSLARSEAPAESFDNYQPKGGEYSWEQVCGQGLNPDYTDSYRALLSAYHDTDLFADEKGMFARLLQRHIRRGLHEIRNGWRERHDFHEFLYQELLSRSQAEEQQAGDMQIRLQAALRELSLDARIVQQTDGARLQSFDVELADANQLRALQRADEKLALILGTGSISIHLPGTPRTVSLQIPKPRNVWRNVLWSEVRNYLPASEEMQLGVCLGFDPLGQTVCFDLSKAPHLLVAGTTNSGKSVALHALLCSLLSRHSAQDLRLCLIDPKQVEFTVYRGLPHLQGAEPITEMEQAVTVLEDVVKEMEQRQAALAKQGLTNLAQWRNQDKAAPPYFVVCVEELADLIMQYPQAEEPLVRLAQKGRASGIHLVLATQRPDSATLSGLLRSNIPSRLGLSVQKASESKIILDENGAEKLLGQGDALLKVAGEGMRRVQCAFLEVSDIKAVVAQAKMK